MIPPGNTSKSDSVPAQFLAGRRLSKYSLLAQLYFFFNSVLLPKGLLYTTLLSPVFFYNAVQQGRKTYLPVFLFLLCSYDLIHLYLGVDLRSFVISNGLFIFTYFTVVPAYHFIANYPHLARLYKEVLLVNSFLLLVALPFFFAPRPQQEWFWYINKLTKGVEEFPRLALFTYEASYYSLLLTPVCFYYFLKLVLGQIHSNKWLITGMTALPLLLSFSFGVLGAMLLTFVILILVFFRRIQMKKRRVLWIISIVLILTFAGAFTFFQFPDHPLVMRVHNIIAGDDTSARGRTTESFAMAWHIAKERSVWFGAGLGQIKILATEMVARHYKYWGNFSRYDIPNAMGETLAIFGLLGVVLRLALECWLFFKTKVYTNYYRLALFIFIFIYQFTGSFITNIAEYVIWILVFSAVFKQFDVKNDNKAFF